MMMCQMSRMVLNMTITEMVDPSMLVQKSDGTSVSSDGSCPWPEQINQIETVTEYHTDAPTFNSLIDTTTTVAPTTQASATQPTTTEEVWTIVVDTLASLFDTTTYSPSTTEPAPLFDTTTYIPPTTEPTPVSEVETTSTIAPFDYDATAAEDEESISPSTTETHYDWIRRRRSIDATQPSVTANNDDERHDEDQRVDEDVHGDKFKWTMRQQSVLLGGFYYSYFVFMIIAGRASEVYGAKYVLMLAVAGSALINLATPWMARNSFLLLVVSRIVMGAIQSGIFPAMYALFNKWLTMTEASIYAPLIKMNLRLGMMAGSAISGFVTRWPDIYYFTGALCAAWSLAWLCLATSTPEENRWVSASELKRINRKKAQPKQVDIELSTVGNGTAEETRQTAAAAEDKKGGFSETPWLKLMTAPAVLGLVVVKTMMGYALDFMSILLPSYLRYVHHADTETISLITTVMFSIPVTLVPFVGWLAKCMIKDRPFGMSKTAIRRLLQGFASFGVASALTLLMFNGCNLIFVAVSMLLVAFFTIFCAGGEMMLPYDLSEEFPATIMGFANCLANMSGVTLTLFTGQVLANQGGNFARWNIIIGLIAALNFVGGLVFTCFVRAEPLDFGKSSGGGGGGGDDEEEDLPGKRKQSGSSTQQREHDQHVVHANQTQITTKQKLALPSVNVVVDTKDGKPASGQLSPVAEETSDVEVMSHASEQQQQRPHDNESPTRDTDDARAVKKQQPEAQVDIVNERAVD